MLSWATAIEGFGRWNCGNPICLLYEGRPSVMQIVINELTPSVRSSEKYQPGGTKTSRHTEARDKGILCEVQRPHLREVREARYHDTTCSTD
jgi:hypothetical protein